MKLALRDRGCRASVRSSNAFVLRPRPFRQPSFSPTPDYVKLIPTIGQTKRHTAVASSSRIHRLAVPRRRFLGVALVEEMIARHARTWRSPKSGSLVDQSNPELLRQPVLTMRLFITVRKRYIMDTFARCTVRSLYN